MKNNKPVIILTGAIVALFVISFVVRFVALSELGLPGGWMLLFGLPAGGIGLLVVLVRLGMLNSVNSTVRQWPPNGVTHIPANFPPPAAPTSQRLQEIENLRASGAISTDEYTAERARIIASL
jgi:hypothetical protein